jgi:hypothetical protein
MTDFEDRLGSALRAAAEDAPGAAGLADAARGRSRARRRRTALASTAGVVAAAAVVGGVALLGSGNDGPSRVATDTVDPAATTRVETWHDVSVTVPASWGHGNLDDWCSNGESDGSPVVERPGAVSIDILCTPMYGYGVQFLDGTSGVSIEAFSPGTVNRSVSDDYPKGSWQGYEQAGRTRVLVVAPTKEEAEEVLGSFQHVTGVDANGCAPHAEGVTLAAEGTLQLCRYSVDGRLEQSEVLRGQDAADAVAALDSAPASPAKPCPSPTSGYVMVTGADMSSSGQVSLDACAGVSWGDEHRDVTADVLHWVLSPGWTGQIPDGIGTFEPRR